MIANYATAIPAIIAALNDPTVPEVKLRQVYPRICNQGTADAGMTRDMIVATLALLRCGREGVGCLERSARDRNRRGNLHRVSFVKLAALPH